MKKFSYKYEQLLRKNPRIWHPGYIIHRIIQKEILLFSKFIQEKNSGAVLDFGCGKSPFRAYFKEYKGADINTSNKEPDFLINEKNNRIEGVSDNSIENIISIEVIEHVPDLPAFIHEAERILKPNGFFLIVAPFVYNYHGNDDYARYSKNYFLKNPLFKNFEIIKINASPNDFIEFITYNINHFLGIFPIIRFAYPLFLISNIIGLALTATAQSLFRALSFFSPKFQELYNNSFLLFPLQISVILRKKDYEKN